MTIAETRREGMVQLDVEGRVDTNTSPELQKKILQAFQKDRKSTRLNSSHDN